MMSVGFPVCLARQTRQNHSDAGRKRRKFITILGGAANAWPRTARAQQPERMRRIGVLGAISGDDQDAPARITAFQEGLQQLGWIVGVNVQIDYRWSAGDAESTRKHAAELIALAPDLILTSGTATMGPLLQATRSLPIVFVTVADPVGAGFVGSLARPGGNATGFTAHEDGFGGKWLELLKEIAPGTTRAAVIRDPAITAGIGQFGVNPGHGAVGRGGGEPGQRARCQRDRERHRGIRALLEWRPDRDGERVGGRLSRLIVTLAARHRLPAVYPYRFYVTAGGLMSYGLDLIDQFRRAAGYVDRILRGEKPSDLPVQVPVKYETVINLKAAKALGLQLPASVLARADEVID